MELIYYDGGNKEKRTQVAQILAQFPISYALIEQSDGNATIAELFGLEARKEPASGLLPPLDLMIFHDLEDDLIMQISQALKMQNAHVERKCVVTEHNQTWKLADLLQEIMEEHAYFQSYDLCKQLITEVSSMDENTYTKSSWSNYQSAFMKAYLLLQHGKPDKAQLDQAIKDIQQARQMLQSI